MFKDYNIKGILVFTLNALVSAAFSYFLTDNLTNNTDALNLVANIFSILTGFLLLVITMSGDTASITANLSSDEKYNQDVRFNMRFNKYYTLFIVYLSVLVLIFIHYLLAKNTTNKHEVFLYSKSTISYTITFLTSLSFIQSVFIPLKIKEIYEEKKLLSK